MMFITNANSIPLIFDIDTTIGISPSPFHILDASLTRHIMMLNLTGQCTLTPYFDIRLSYIHFFDNRGKMGT